MEVEMGDKPPDKLILCVAPNCDQPVVVDTYYCQEHQPVQPAR
jgi:hypothetical protein